MIQYSNKETPYCLIPFTLAKNKLWKGHYIKRYYFIISTLETSERFVNCQFWAFVHLPLQGIKKKITTTKCKLKTLLLYQSIQKFIKSELRVRITSFPVESNNSTKALHAGVIMEWLWNKKAYTVRVIVNMKSHV